MKLAAHVVMVALVGPLSQWTLACGEGAGCGAEPAVAARSAGSLRALAAVRGGKADPNRAYLGIQLSAPEPAEEEETAGIMVGGVFEGSPAEEAGLAEGDLVTHVGQQAVEGVESFVELIGDHAPGNRVNLTVLRDGESLSIPVNLGSWPSQLQHAGRMGEFRFHVVPDDVHGANVLGPHGVSALYQFGEPRTTFQVNQDGSVEVRVRKGDAELVKRYDRPEDMPEKLIDQYNELQDALE